MRYVRCLCLALAVICGLSLAVPAFAAEVECDAAYCFSAGDFAPSEEQLCGICITELPDSGAGTVLLGSRVLRAGDILTAQQVEQMVFWPLQTQEDRVAEVVYLPIYEDRVEPAAVMTLSIRGKQDKAPVAQDSVLETYKNLSNDGKLIAADPEEQTVVYTLVRQPRRGTVELREDGTFTYTPKKNKVGVDSFTFKATDPAGNVSREATVTVNIMKPTDSKLYRDTQGLDCRFSAQWLRNTGLFAGEQVGGDACFFPDKTVTRGEFLSMLVNLLEIPVEQTDAPDWVQPYLDAAIRSGLVSGWQQESFDMNGPVTGAETAVALQNALDLSAGHEEIVYGEEVPSWAATSLAVMAANGVELEAATPMTRGQIAQVLYQVSRMAIGAPGVMVFSMQK
ncbi:MAG: S-layer homology domain-containing protein [Oscillospiraceae bacterium]|nr:S-layer homology domain-containing protein [Oscillospiraceae bacterium]